MDQPPLPLTRELLLIGGGHTHALVLRKWGMRPLPGVRVTVVNPGPTAPYTGMLPGFVAGHYSRDDLDIDLVRLARFAGARVILDRVVALDPVARVATLAAGRRLPFHVASIDIGITSDLPALPGFAEHAIAAKPLETYAQRWEAFRATATERAKITVIGGGVGGVELALAMQHGLQNGADVTVIDRSDPLEGLGRAARGALLRLLDRRAITLLPATEVTEVAADAVVLTDGRRLPSDLTVGVAGARPQGWLAETGLQLSDGFITVEPTLRARGHDHIYAVGDCAHLAHAPRPKAGVFAVRQAPVLYDNLVAALSGQGHPRRYDPQRDYLKLISLGGKAALADKWGIPWQGRALWRLKDRIDRKFMDQFKALAPMPLPALPALHAEGMAEALGSKPLCGGCGAKVGGAALADVLAHLPAPDRADVLTAPGDDAAVLALPGGTAQVLTTDHLRQFTADPWLMARIAALHALGDVWAMGAMPQAALATIILPRLSPELQAAWLAEIMDAAAQVFAAEGAAIVGGHTSIGSELTVGFTVTGTSPRAPILLSGAQPGDVIVLTRPIGTGVIMAAEMAMQARGASAAMALSHMSQSQGGIARLLADVAHAMTDITGFGLAGHLMGMARASGLTIALDAGAVPLLPGALELSKAGSRSTLYPDNRALWPDLATSTPRLDLMFDPQTAGPLAAAIPRAALDELIERATEIGVNLYRIGLCAEGPAGLSLV